MQIRNALCLFYPSHYKYQFYLGKKVYMSWEGKDQSNFHANSVTCRKQPNVPKSSGNWNLTFLMASLTCGHAQGL